METKKLILAIALSIIVIALYQYFFMPKPQIQPGKNIANEAAQQMGTESRKKTEPAETENIASDRSLSEIFAKKKKVEEVKEPKLEKVTTAISDSTSRDIVVETNLYRAVFTNIGAGLKSFILKKYKDDKKNQLDLISSKVFDKFGDDIYLPFYFSTFEGEDYIKEINKKRFRYNLGEITNIKVEGNSGKIIEFEFADPAKNVLVKKRFVLNNNSYIIDVQITFIKDGKNLDFPVMFGPDLANNILPVRTPGRTLILKGFDGNKVQEVNLFKVKGKKVNESIGLARGIMNGFFSWIAYERPYFATMIRSRDREAEVKYFTVSKKGKKGGVKSYSYITFTNPSDIYMGPKDEEELAKIENRFPEANKVIDYGWSIFGAIAKLMLKGLIAIHKSIPNYGWALILLTLVIKVILFPLTYSSSVSMAKMQTLQPKIKAIKKKYKNLKDPEQRKRMNAETMALYKTEKVNPAGGCLPLLLQMPVFFGLFRLLQTSINIRHEPWILWIKDLSLKDPVYVLPILMGVTQIIVTKMSPTSADSSQKKMTYIMPVVMVFLFMNFSSGLNLYWFMSNLLQIGQQYIINKKIFAKKKEEDKMRKILKKKKRGK